MKITYDLIATPNAYGFGHTWALNLVRGNQTKQFYLGQDVKVVSRVLGMRMDRALLHYKKKAGSDKFEVVKDYIAADILRAKLDTQRLTQEQLETLFMGNKWELAIE